MGFARKFFGNAASRSSLLPREAPRPGDAKTERDLGWVVGRQQKTRNVPRSSLSSTKKKKKNFTILGDVLTIVQYSSWCQPNQQ